MEEPQQDRTGSLVIAGAALAVLLVAGLVVLGARQLDRTSAEPTADRRSRSPAGHSTAGPLIPDDFPLLAGYPTWQAETPDGGLQGPDRTRPPIVLEACGHPVIPRAHTDLLRAGWTDVEDFRQRQLTTYVDEDAAQQYVAAVLGAYRDCPREDSDDGYTTVHTVLDTELGDVGAVATSRYELDGRPALGHTLVVVVRVGSAVLLALSSNEGGGGPDVERQLREAAADGVAETADVVAAMCRFTSRGC